MRTTRRTHSINLPALLAVVTSLTLSGCGGSGTFSPTGAANLQEAPTSSPKAGSDTSFETAEINRAALSLLKGMQADSQETTGAGAVPFATDYIRKFKAGDKFVANMWATAAGQISPVHYATNKVVSTTYAGHSYLAFLQTSTGSSDTYKQVFTQNATTRDITTLASYKNGSATFLPPKFPGRLYIGSTFNLFDDTGRLGFKMTIKSKENLKVTAGTFLCYKATSTVIKDTDPTFNPVSMTIWITPNLGPDIRETLVVDHYSGIRATAYATLRSYQLAP